MHTFENDVDKIIFFKISIYRLLYLGSNYLSNEKKEKRGTKQRTSSN